MPRPSVNTGHFRVPSATGCCGVFLAATVLRRGFATMTLRLSPYPAIGGFSPSLCFPWLGEGLPPNGTYLSQLPIQRRVGGGTQCVP